MIFLMLLGAVIGWKWSGWHQAFERMRDEAIVANIQRVLEELKQVLSDRALAQERLVLCSHRERVQAELLWSFVAREQQFLKRHRHVFRGCLALMMEKIHVQQHKTELLADMVSFISERQKIRAMYDRCTTLAAWIAGRCIAAQEARLGVVEETAKNARLRLEIHARRHGIMTEIRSRGKQRHQFRDYLERMNCFESVLHEMMQYPPNLHPIHQQQLQQQFSQPSVLDFIILEMVFTLLMILSVLFVVVESLYMAIPELPCKAPRKKNRPQYRGDWSRGGNVISKHPGNRPMSKRNRFHLYQ